ncbi:Hypothetical predicted protein [Paramuricea clavata]|uniref:Uncharacterized protein n=1 Tax=Paramuricea clavata TaxID=317549 RepID=A0A6S7HMC4_PARCT|nr:Hypothetical predicted protein [Paramuricea clavata]
MARISFGIIFVVVVVVVEGYYYDDYFPEEKSFRKRKGDDYSPMVVSQEVSRPDKWLRLKQRSEGLLEDYRRRGYNIPYRQRTTYWRYQNIRPKSNVYSQQTEFSSFLEGIIVSPGQLLIAGDFNFHLDNPNDPLTKRFVDLLASFDLKQYISGSTHASGHTLDLIITRSEENIVNHYNIFDPLISDHSVVHLQLLIRKPKFVKKHLLLRNLRAVNIHKFKTDVLNSFLLKNFTTMDLVSLVNEYDCLHTILDNHAPIKSREITLRPKAPWYTNEINDKKRIRRQLERKWHKTRTNADWNRYKQQCYAVNKLIDSSKSAYYTDLINNGSSDQKTLFKTVSNLLHTNTIIRYPSSPDPMSLANSFSDFFTQKIVKIRSDIEDELLSKNIENPIPDADSCPYEFHTFREVGKDEVLHLIQRIATKSCSLDPLPVVMLNHCFKDILPVVARIINLSLESGTMPDSLKIAVVQPLLKKYNLSYEEFCSFRPISNLKFVSKSIEKAVAVQLTDYLTENHLHEKFQSAYKLCHSTETALLRVQNDILQALDNGDSVILVLLDLSAAFDTADHLMLLTRLSKRFGIRGRVLDWLTSYLTSRKLFIRVEGTDSLLSDLDCGVPQGSVLGPLLYSLYTAPLADVARRHNLRFHFFSGDGQLYIAFKTNDRDDLISSKIRMEKCILELGNCRVTLIYDDVNGFLERHLQTTYHGTLYTANSESAVRQKITNVAKAKD